MCWVDLTEGGLQRKSGPRRLLGIALLWIAVPSTLSLISGELSIIIWFGILVAALLLVTAFAILLVNLGGPAYPAWAGTTYLLMSLFSPLALILVSLCSLAVWSPWALWLGGGIGLPFFTGAVLTDIGTVAIYQHARTRRMASHKRRQGGPEAELPEHRAWTLARWMRYLGLLGSGVGAFLVIVGPDARQVWPLGVLLLVFAAGVARLDAVVIAALGRGTLIAPWRQPDGWRITYLGRVCLAIPSACIRRVLTDIGHGPQASAAILTFMRESALAPAVRRACRGLPTAYLLDILYHLSLRNGGATALDNLATALPSALQRVARRYADLAREASKPVDLQQWLAVLPHEVHMQGQNGLNELLVQVREALLSFDRTASLERTIHKFAPFLAPDGDDRTRAWPEALHNHLLLYAHHLHCQASLPTRQRADSEMNDAPSNAEIG